MKKGFLKAYKVFFTIIIFILIFSCTINKTADNSAGDTLTSPSRALSPDDYSIDYSVNDDWGSGFVVEVTISNNSNSSISNWTLTWIFSGNQQITNAWNSDLSQSGNAVTVNGASHNEVIPAGGSINFGFQGVYSGTNDNPADFALDAESSSSSSVSSSSSSSSSVSSSSISSSSSSSTTSSSSSSTGGIIIDYIFDNDWGTGSVVKLTITNNSTSNVSDWTLEWDFPGNQALSGHWNAVLVQTGKHVTAIPAAHNKNIPVGSSVEFGFQYTYSGTNEKPSSFTFNGSQTSSSSSSSSSSSLSSSSSSSSLSSTSSSASSIGNIATPNGYAQGTTGGGNASPVTVSSASEFKSAVSGDSAKVIIVNGRINLGSDVEIGSNTTLKGANTNSGLYGGTVRIRGTNYIIQNLTFGPANEDVMEITGGSKVFIHKCTFHDSTDELCSIVRGADYVTISYCRFYFDNPDSHSYAHLIGNSDSATGDRGKLHVTLHHNWYDNGVKGRQPRVRFGYVHIYNCYWGSNNADYCIGVGKECHIRVENSHFDNIKGAWSDYGGSSDGLMAWSDLKFEGCSQPTFISNSYPGFSLPYSYNLDSVDDVEAIVKASAGNR